MLFTPLATKLREAGLAFKVSMSYGHQCSRAKGALVCALYYLIYLMHRYKQDCFVSKHIDTDRSSVCSEPKIGVCGMAIAEAWGKEFVWGTLSPTLFFAADVSRG